MNTRLVRTVLLVSVLILAGCSDAPATGGSGSSGGGGGGGTPSWGQASKSSGCKASGPLQDSACTPGDLMDGATKAKICTSGYASSVRDVPTSLKNKVYAAYGIKTHTAGQYEVDHLVSLELGGSNDITNLWPEAASPKPGFHEKDKVENYLHDQVCDGAISLKEAQRMIATNWLDVYQQMQQK